MKQVFKLHLLTACLMFLAEGVYADSSSNSGVIVTPNTSNANQTYLLDSGTINFLPAGTQWIGGDPGGAGCSGTCAGGTNYKGVCAKGFIPYFVTTPFKSGNLQTSASSGSVGVNAICPTNFNMSPGGNYQIGFGFTSLTTPATGAINISGSAFNWYIYCIPGSYSNSYGPNQWTTNGVTPGYTVSNWVPGCTSCSDTSPQCCAATSATSLCSSGSLAPSGVTQATPIVWETGTWNNVGVDPGYFWITTTRLCPLNYSPSVELVPYKGFTPNPGTGTNSELNKIAVCPLSSVIDNNNFKEQASGYAIKFTASTQNNLSNLGVKWKITCYPPGMSPPIFDTSCTLPTQNPNPTTWTYAGQPNFENLYFNNIAYTASQFKDDTVPWWIPFHGPFITNPSWPAIYAPYTGYYDFALNVTAYSNLQVCLMFQLYNGTNFTRFNSDSYFKYTDGAWKMIFSNQLPGWMSGSMFITGVYIPAGTPLFVVVSQTADCTTGSRSWIGADTTLIMSYTGAGS